jgi:hypothetical protein
VTAKTSNDKCCTGKRYEEEQVRGRTGNGKCNSRFPEGPFDCAQETERKTARCVKILHSRGVGLAYR